jgi:hypothetical protein
MDSPIQLRSRARSWMYVSPALRAGTIKH